MQPGRSTAAEALENLLGSLDSAGKMRESMALAYWPRVVGPQAAAASIAEVSRDGALYIRTKSAAWSQELSLMKGHILAELNRLVGRPVIRDLRFRATGIEPPAATPHADFPSAEEIAAVALSTEDEALLADTVHSLKGLREDGPRESLVTLCRRQAQVRRWRLGRGWAPCRRCGSLAEPGQSVCAFCVLERRTATSNH